jgi:predicted DCC family thiol-disulfide oxidoreductase YuxK
MPEGLAPGAPRHHVIVFYDGNCGLCHHLVSFLVPRDRDGARFKFAAQQGATFAALLSQQQRDALPDSVVLLMPDGTLHVRWNAACETLRQLGGLWRVPAALMTLAPHPLRDWFYDAVARRRRRWFAAPIDTCPLMPPHLHDRFLP